MKLIGLDQVLNGEEATVVEALAPKQAVQKEFFSRGTTSSKIMLVDILGEGPGRYSGLHVLKIASNDREWQPEEVSRIYNTIKQSDIADSVPDLVDFATVGNFSAFLFSVVGDAANSFQTLAQQIRTNVSAAEEGLNKVASLLTRWQNLSQADRRTDFSVKLYQDCINCGKNRLVGPDSVAERLRQIGVSGLSDNPRLMFEGGSLALPNPVAYAMRPELWLDHKNVQPVAMAHGDLHTENIILDLRRDDALFIDWSTYNTAQNYFFDWAYLELSIVIHSFDLSGVQSIQEWQNFCEHACSGQIKPAGSPAGYHAPQIWRLIQPLRSEVDRQIAVVQKTLGAYAEASFWLALSAAGLNFARKKSIDPRTKRFSLLYSASAMSRALRLLSIKVPALDAPLMINLSRPSFGTDSVRSCVVKYAEKLSESFREWRDRYTPMSGRITPQNRLSPIRTPAGISPIFARPGTVLGQAEVKVQDIAREVLSRRRAIICGAPGAGKSTTVWNLVAELASKLQNDADGFIPIMMDLSTIEVFSADLIVQIEKHVSQTLVAVFGAGIAVDQFYGRCFLLLDAVRGLTADHGNLLNGAVDELMRLEKFAGVVLTARSQDLAPQFSQFRIEILPLDPLQIRGFLRSHLGDDDGDDLFWQLVDPKAKSDYFPRFIAGGGNEFDFWMSDTKDMALQLPWYYWDWPYWKKMRDNPANLLSLARNPYLLFMLSAAYVSGTKLPSNRSKLIESFVESMMLREEQYTESDDWIEIDEQVRRLGELAYRMSADQTQSISNKDAIKALNGSQLLRLATSEGILRVSGDVVQFVHDMIRDFFVSAHSQRTGEISSLLRSPFETAWWLPVGWSETSILVGPRYLGNPEGVLDELKSENPELAASCILSGEVEVRPEIVSRIAVEWLKKLTDVGLSVDRRASFGRALGVLNLDMRPGVAQVDAQGLPVFDWCPVPETNVSLAEFLGLVPLFSISRFLVTNRQYEAFTIAGGYSELHRHCWTMAGWESKGQRVGPENYSEMLCLSNHPRVGVNWYEAVAFCRWITKAFRGLGRISDREIIRLPTEAEWVAAAGGPNSNRFPWGDRFDRKKCNLFGIEGTTAVGIFPDGAAACGALDMIGSAWKWCSSTPGNPNSGNQDADLEGTAMRVYRGGSWGLDIWDRDGSRYNEENVVLTNSHAIIPEDDGPDAISFFVVLSTVNG